MRGGDAGFARNDPDLLQPQTIRFARVVLGVANARVRRS